MVTRDPEHRDVAGSHDVLTARAVVSGHRQCRALRDRFDLQHDFGQTTKIGFRILGPQHSRSMTKILYVAACCCCLTAVFGVVGLFGWSQAIQNSSISEDSESARLLFSLWRYVVILGGLGQVLPLAGAGLFWVYGWAEGTTSLTVWTIVIVSGICAFAMGGIGMITGSIVIITALKSSNIAFWSRPLFP